MSRRTTAHPLHTRFANTIIRCLDCWSGNAAGPQVRGALAAVLGEGYALHPHRFLHHAGAADQVIR